MKPIYHIALLLLIMLLVSCADKATNPVDNRISLGFSPLEVTISVAEETTIQLKAFTLSEPVFGMSMQIEYDSSAVTFMGGQIAEEGNIFGESALFFLQNEGEIIHLTITQTQGQSEVTGTGSLALLTFTGLAPDSGNIRILPDKLHFYDEIGDEIDVLQIELSEAWIVVTNP